MKMLRFRADVLVSLVRIDQISSHMLKPQHRIKQTSRTPHGSQFNSDAISPIRMRQRIRIYTTKCKFVHSVAIYICDGVKQQQRQEDGRALIFQARRHKEAKTEQYRYRPRQACCDSGLNNCAETSGCDAGTRPSCLLTIAQEPRHEAAQGY